MLQSRRVRLLLLLLLLIGLTPACVQGDETPDDGALIGPDGGTLSGPGGLVLEIPLGALSETLDIAVYETSAPDSDLVQVSRFYRIEPAGTRFDIPATLTIPYDPDAVPSGRREAEIRMVWIEEASEAPQVLDDTLRRSQTARARIVGLGIFGAALPAPEGEAPPPSLVTPDQIDFGLISVGETETQSILLRNAGAGDLLLDQVVLEPAGVFSLTAPPAPGTLVPPYSELVLPLVFSPDAQTVFEAELTITSNDPATPQRRIPLRGRGAGVGRLAVDPATVTFEDTPLGDENEQTLTVENVGEGPLVVFALDLPEIGVFRVEDANLPFTLPQGETRALTLVFAPQEAVFYEVALQIGSDDAETPQREVRLTGTGTQN